MKIETKLQQVQEGKSKAQAKGVTRKPEKGYGIAIIKANDQASASVRDCIITACKKPQATLLLAIQEVEQERDKRVREYGNSDIGEKKKKSTRVVFARILTILRAYSKGELRQQKNILAAPSLAEMYAYSSRKVGKTDDKRKGKPFTADQFARWNKGLSKVVGALPGRNPENGEREKFDDQIARLEQHFMMCLHTLSKLEGVTYIPVKAMLSLAHKDKKHLKAVRIRKAA
jgi:hypothetical protein